MKVPSKITRRFIRDHRHAIFVFGDNIAGKGYGGQAKEARGEPNAWGLPTKWKPDNRLDSFFTDGQFREVKEVVDALFRDLRIAMESGFEVVFFPGIGTGLADLQNRAPKTLAYIREKIRKIEEGINDERRRTDKVEIPF